MGHFNKYYNSTKTTLLYILDKTVDYPVLILKDMLREKKLCNTTHHSKAS